MKPWSVIAIGRLRAMLPLLLVAVASAASTAGASPMPAPSADGVQRNQDWYMVVDAAGILDDRQEQSAIFDAYRLNLIGIPTQVVTEPVGLNQNQADARADELRIGQEIASVPGADDGILIYASVDSNDSTNVVMSISAGTRTLPRNGLNADTLDDIRRRIMSAQLADGHPARAIVYSLREMIYLEQYVPPPAPVVTGWRAEIRPRVDILSPLAGVAGIAWLVVEGKRQPRAGRLALVAPLACGLGAMLLVALAVTCRSSPGVFSAIALAGVATWRSVLLDRELAAGFARTLVVTPRPPRSRATAR